MTVFEILSSGRLEPLNLNCSEKIVYAANRAYGLGLDEKTIRLSSAFGGGMGCGRTCGALSGTVMIIGLMFTEGTAHATPNLKPITGEAVYRFGKKFGSVECSYLKPKYRRPDVGCSEIILEAARILDEIAAQKCR